MRKLSQRWTGLKRSRNKGHSQIPPCSTCCQSPCVFVPLLFRLRKGQPRQMYLSHRDFTHFEPPCFTQWIKSLLVLEAEPLRAVRDCRILWVKPASDLWILFTTLLTLVILSVLADFYCRRTHPSEEEAVHSISRQLPITFDKNLSPWNCHSLISLLLSAQHGSGILFISHQPSEPCFSR